MNPVDFGRPSTWLPYRNNLCDGCRADCCRLPVEVSVDDLVLLGLASPDEIHAPKRLAKRLVHERFVDTFRARTGLFVLAQRPDGACIFLDGKSRCTVYERRPEVCRRFPKELGPRVGFCPARRVSA